MTDYPSGNGNFGKCSFSRSGPIVRTNRHTDTQTDSNERFTPATLVGVSNDDAVCFGALKVHQYHN